MGQMPQDVGPDAPGGPRGAILKPLDPRLRALLLSLRQACYIIGDALGLFCGAEPRQRTV